MKLSDLIVFARRPKPRLAPAKREKPAKQMLWWVVSGLENMPDFRVAAPTKSEARARVKDVLRPLGLRGRLPMGCIVTPDP